MDDLISRQAAIDALKEKVFRNLTDEFYGAMQVLDELPSTESERKTGEWVSNHDGSWNCSECGLRVLVYAKGNYCPNCGARMVKEDGEA